MADALLEWALLNPVLTAAAVIIALLLPAVVWLARQRKAPEPADTSAQALAHIYQQYGTSETLRKNAVASAKPVSVKVGETVALPAIDGAEAPVSARLWLDFLESGLPRVRVEAATVSIGRHSDNDIVLENKTVHRRHVRLELNQRKRFEIVDLGGVNGTQVNGQRCSRRELKNGDLIELGEVKIRVNDA